MKKHKSGVRKLTEAEYEAYILSLQKQSDASSKE